MVCNLICKNSRLVQFRINFVPFRTNLVPYGAISDTPGEIRCVYGKRVVVSGSHKRREPRQAAVDHRVWSQTHVLLQRQQWWLHHRRHWCENLCLLLRICLVVCLYLCQFNSNHDDCIIDIHMRTYIYFLIFLIYFYFVCQSKHTVLHIVSVNYCVFICVNYITSVAYLSIIYLCVFVSN